MFEYGNPEAILAELLPTLKPNGLGHTAIDDWQHFCSYTGCDPNNVWAKLAYVSVWREGDDLRARISELEVRAEKAAELISKAVGRMKPEDG